MDERRRQRPKLHDREVPIDAALVQELIADQFPALAGLRIREIRSSGTVNAIYRVGDQLCVRLPRVEDWAPDVEKEWAWLPRLAPHLSLHIPEPVGKGAPTPAYPFPWAVYTWIDGLPYADERIADERSAAADLARFIAGLRALEPVAEAPPGGAGPLPSWTP